MKNNAIVRYFRESLQELHAVTWPTRNQMIRLTAIVLGFTVVMSGFIALVDYLFSTGNSFLLGITF